jgi:peptidoglycan/LPS O-acetylase OafA/YrhL
MRTRPDASETPGPEARSVNPIQETVPNSSRLTSIDALRGFAALWVLIDHAIGPMITPLTARWPWMAPLLFPVAIGYVGVHLFLVISGFCIHQKLAASTPRDEPMRLKFAEFWSRRFWRLYPPYLVVLIGCSVLMVVLNAWLHDRSLGQGLAMFWHESRWDLITHIFMLHIFFGGLVYGMLNSPLWSLALEEHLYLLYAPFLWMRNKLSMRGALIAVACVCVTYRCFAYFVLGSRPQPAELEIPGVATYLMLQAPARWLEWCLGALAVEAVVGRARLPAWCSRWSTAAMACVAAILVARTPAHFLLSDMLWGLCFFSLINASIAAERRCDLTNSTRTHHRLVRLLAWFGGFSYSIYLVHMPLIVLTTYLSYNAGIQQESPMLALTRTLAIPVALVLAYVFHRVVEQRFLRPAPQIKSRSTESRSLTIEPPTLAPLSRQAA